MSTDERLECGHAPGNRRGDRCKACDHNERYENDPEYREAAKARSRNHHRNLFATATPDELWARRIRRNELERKRYAADPKPHQDRIMRSKYGIGLEEYDAKLAAQGGLCAICERENTGGRRLSVDHDHDSDAVRDLLCNPCNTTLGLMNNDPELLRKAAAYLERWAA